MGDPVGRRGRFLTTEFTRLVALWVVVCLANLVFWYVKELRAVNWRRGALLISLLFAVSLGDALLLPRLKGRTALTVLITVAEAAFIMWLAWLPALAGN